VSTDTLEEVRELSDSDNFDNMLIQAIDAVLVKIFGSEGARSIKFYIDPNIALKDADVYADSLERMFKEGAKIILNTIIDELYRKTGKERAAQLTFSEAVALLKGGIKPSPPNDIQKTSNL
jgi:hypothetical protein